MGALRTCCGYYCAFTALVGVYFFVVLIIMELKGNQVLLQVKQVNEDLSFQEQKDGMKSVKAVGFGILAIIQVVLVFACYFCGKASADADENAKNAEIREMQQKQYQRVEGDDHHE